MYIELSLALFAIVELCLHKGSWVFFFSAGFMLCCLGIWQSKQSETLCYLPFGTLCQWWCLKCCLYRHVNMFWNRTVGWKYRVSLKTMPSAHLISRQSGPSYYSDELNRVYFFKGLESFLGSRVSWGQDERRQRKKTLPLWALKCNRDV